MSVQLVGTEATGIARKAASHISRCLGAAMSEDVSDCRIIDPASVWAELDDAIQERVITTFVVMAIKVVTSGSDGKKGGAFVPSEACETYLGPIDPE